MKKLIFLSLLSSLMNSEVQAQFKKFKTPSRRNSAPPVEAIDSSNTTEVVDTSSFDENSPAPEVDPQDKAQGPDVFGRGTWVKDIKNVPPGEKYVNLNPETAFGPEVITSFDFPDVTLLDLTKHMQKLTGMNLILDKDIKGKISILAPTPITVGDAWKAYLTALNINGYTLVKSGSFYKIVNARDIRYTPTKIYTGEYAPDTENYVMKIVALKNINAAAVTRSFRPFMSRYGRIIDIPQTNTVIVQDTGSNINRLSKLIAMVDVPGHEETLQIIQVKNSSAQEISRLLDQILKDKNSKKNSLGSSSTQQQSISKIIAEPRTNSIIAMANGEGAKELRNLITKLDVKYNASSSGQIHVYYLNYGDSETLSKTLSALISGASAKKTGASPFTTPATAGSSLFNADVKITSDKDNNAMVVTASPTDYLTIKEVIKKLDIPRDQVFVEGLIMETSVDKERGFGISILGGYGTGNMRRAGFTGGSQDIYELISTGVSSIGGLFVGGSAGKKVTTTVGDKEVEISSINGLIKAVAANSNTNVLATPQILTLDNTEGVFEVGEEVPTITKTDTASGSSSSTKYEKVALTLKITPQIDDFSGRALPEDVSKQALAKTTRSAVTTVVVRDRDTIAMGGLMRDRDTAVENKVPLLGDIPILGWLFKQSSTKTSKVNLIFFLTPRIVASYAKDSSEIVKDVLNRRNAHLKDFIGDDDLHATTAKGLYEKAKKQAEGPLYNIDEASKYHRSNEETGIGRVEIPDDTEIEKIDAASLIEPNYQEIMQKTENKEVLTPDAPIETK
jgi:general secretion pathway protein D